MVVRCILAIACVAHLLSGEAAPIVFRAEALQVSVRLPIADGRAQPEHRLTLVADQPRDRTVLRLSEPHFTIVTADSGERLGLLLRPASRVQQVANDRQARRDRMLRLNLDLSPPERDVRSLLDLHGSVQLTIGEGQTDGVPISLRPRPEKPVAIAGIDGGTVQVEEVAERRVVLVLSPSLAERLAEVSFADAAGALVVAKAPQNRPADGGAVRLHFEIESGEAASARIAWFPVLRSETVEIRIPRLDVPGGIPGIGTANAPPPSTPAVKLPQLKQPLHVAIAMGDGDAVRRILAADPTTLERPEGDGRRPLHRAVVMGRIDLALVLLQAGADPAARTREGAYTALDLAATGGDTACVETLLAGTADLGAVIPSNGWSVLHQAVNAGAQLTVQSLLTHGADPWLPGKDGRSAIDLARDLGRWPILRLLLGNPPPSP